jgi:hypothetical protein
MGRQNHLRNGFVQHLLLGSHDNAFEAHSRGV